MSGLEDIRTRLSEPQLPPAEVPMLAQLAGALGATAEAEKNQAETEKLRLETANMARLARSESLRFWIPILAPVISAFALVATLLFQVHQLNENVRIQNENTRIQSENTRIQNEDTQFRSALQVIRMPTGLASLTGTILLKSFLRSEFHREQSREILLSLLSATANPESFRLLFEDLFGQPELSRLPDAVRVSRTLESVRNQSSIAVEKLEKLVRDGVAPSRSKELEDRKNDLATMPSAQAMVGNYIARGLRLPRAANSIVELSGANFWEIDLGGIDFRLAELIDTVMQNTNVKDAGLGEVSGFEGSSWDYTAWWRARRISPALLAYLEGKYRYKPDMQYLSDSSTRKEYLLEIKRLRDQR